MNVFEVSATALTAQSIRLDAISGNMANAQVVTSSADAAYKARMPVFATLFREGMDGSEISGVEVRRLAQSRVAVEKRYEPDHPMANEGGFVFEANVNLVEEMANMMSASKSYTSNVEVMITSRELLQRTLAIGN
ncbi:MAG: flagellar basal body rod protein FlgC [Halieaceae bacterium]